MNESIIFNNITFHKLESATVFSYNVFVGLSNLRNTKISIRRIYRNKFSGKGLVYQFGYVNLENSGRFDLKKNSNSNNKFWYC